MRRAPKIAIINRDRVLAREVLDVEVGILASRDAEVGLAARVGRVIDVAALVGEHAVDGGGKVGRIIHAGSVGQGRGRITE